MAASALREGLTRFFMPTLKCKETNVSFGVSTYHMPCMFRTAADRRVMVIHAGIAAQYALNQSEGLQLVLMGDFNFSRLEPVTRSSRLETWTNRTRAALGMPAGYPGSRSTSSRRRRWRARTFA